MVEHEQPITCRFLALVTLTFGDTDYGLSPAFLVTCPSRCFGVASRVAQRRLNADARKLICVICVASTGGMIPICMLGLLVCFRCVSSLSAARAFCPVTCGIQLRRLTKEGHTFSNISWCSCALELIHALLIFVQPRVNYTDTVEVI